ncbi:HU family DNA-binding protein [Acidobacteriota bacterium]
MTKADLLEAVMQATDLSKKQAETVVETFFRCLISSLSAGDGVELRGFGSFRIRQRGARNGRNPKTGAPVKVGPKKVVYFKMGKELKELINPPA